MYGYVKLIIHKNDSGCTSEGGISVIPLVFLRVGLHASIANDGAIEGDLGAFYLIFIAVKYQTTVVCYMH